jgi:hypothetical protein
VPLAAVALLAPAAAQAASLTADHRCYYANEPKKHSTDTVTLTGKGFTPDGEVTLGKLAETADDTGAFTQTVKSPVIKGASGKLTFRAVDESNPALTASTTVRFTKLGVRLLPKNFEPRKRVLVKARGFLETKYLYAHVRRGSRYHKNVRVGRLKTCGVLSRRKHLFGRRLQNGIYSVQFDGSRRYKRSTRPASRFKVRISGVKKSAAASVR